MPSQVRARGKAPSYPILKSGRGIPRGLIPPWRPHRRFPWRFPRGAPQDTPPRPWGFPGFLESGASPPGGLVRSDERWRLIPQLPIKEAQTNSDRKPNDAAGQDGREGETAIADFDATVQTAKPTKE